MTSDFIENLFKKRGEQTPEKIEDAFKLIEEMVEKKEGIQSFGRLIESFTDKLNLADKFWDFSPFYYDKAGMWWVWKGSHAPSEPVGDLIISKKADGNDFYEMWDDIDILNSITYASSANTINSKEKNEVLQALKQVGRKHTPEEIKKTWIHFTDVVVDIETGDKFGASPDYFFVNPIPHKLGKSENTPKMDKLFEEWVGKEYVKTLYEIIAYCMYKDYPIERIFCLLGGGSNGKSCFLKLLRNFIGDQNIVSTDLDLLIHSRFETSKLRNKMVAMIGETNFEDLNNTSRIKRMTSGKDPIPIEYKNKGGMDYVNYAKLIMATNNLPPTTDKTIGFGRRWCIIDFPNQFRSEKEVLEDIPENEYENLGLKCITLLIELLKKRQFHEEGDIEQRMKNYEEKSNPFDKFWKEDIVDSPESHVWKHEFKDYLNDWLKEHRFRTMSDTTISKEMKKREIDTQRISANFMNDKGQNVRWRAWVGIKFKQEKKDPRVDVQDGHYFHVPPTQPPHRESEIGRADIVDKVDKANKTQLNSGGIKNDI